MFLILFTRYIDMKKELPVREFLVDGIGLEPMTLRTSSGCSTS